MLSDPDTRRQATGTVQAVDTLARELRLVSDGRPLVFDVPPDCAIYLNDERVKLRFLQPLDCAAIDYDEDAGMLVARCIRAGWDFAALRARAV